MSKLYNNIIIEIHHRLKFDNLSLHILKISEEFIRENRLYHIKGEIIYHTAQSQNNLTELENTIFTKKQENIANLQGYLLKYIQKLACKPCIGYKIKVYNTEKNKKTFNFGNREVRKLALKVSQTIENIFLKKKKKHLFL